MVRRTHHDTDVLFGIASQKFVGVTLSPSKGDTQCTQLSGAFMFAMPAYAVA